MTPDVEALLRSPLFQLNAVIWACMDLPSDDPDRQAVLATAGFRVQHVEPELALPPGVLDRLSERTGDLKTRFSPDVVLRNERTDQTALVECKSQSHSSSSSTARQTRSILIAAHRPYQVLAYPDRPVAEDAACYVLPEEACAPMADTLGELAEALSRDGLHTGVGVTLGLSVSDGWIRLQACAAAQRFYGLSADCLPVLRSDDHNDPRPLYLIPFTPGSGDQDETEHGRIVLLMQLHRVALRAMVLMRPGETITLSADGMLADVMPGLYEAWANSGARKHLRKQCSHLMHALGTAVHQRVPGVYQELGNQAWSLATKSQQEHEAAVRVASRFNPATMSLDVDPGDQQSLPFDEDL